MNSQSSQPGDKNRDLYRYASLGTQLLVAIGLAVFIGLKLDGWLKTSPLFSCILPLLVLFGIFYKIARETRKPKKNEGK